MMRTPIPAVLPSGHVPAQMPESYNQGQMLHLIKTTVLPDTADRFFICLKEEGKFVAITGDFVSLKGKCFAYVNLLAKGD